MGIFLKLMPVYKDYLWGGSTLKTEYSKEADITPLAESWELSVHPDGLSIISNGEYKGKTLKYYLENNVAALGKKNITGELPILIKLIDAEDDLSIQVHPDDIQAKTMENQNGKTEVWYVVNSKKDSRIIYGMKEDATKDELENAIRNNTVLDMLSSYSSKKGDIFFVEAGTIHAIGKGNLIAEIQQNSNVTYRLYDYDRRDKNGNLRELHIDKGVRVANTKAIKKRSIPTLSDTTRLVASCKYFQVKELKLKSEYRLNMTEDSYCALLNVDGEAKIGNDIIKQGECIFIPAQNAKISMEGNATILITQNKPQYYVHLYIDGTSINGSVVDEYGVIYGRAIVETLTSRTKEEIIADCVKCVNECVENSGMSFADTELINIYCSEEIDVSIKEYIETTIQKIL